MRRMTAGTALPRRSPVLLLAAGAGAVDAMVIAGFQVLTAAQTGNTILFAVALARGEWRTGLTSGVSVLGFVLGALAGSWILVRAGWTVSRLLVLEILTLCGALALWMLVRDPEPAAASIIILATACAMGLQSAVMLHLNASSTTYVTGVLAAFARDVAAPRRPPSSLPRPAGKEGFVWLVYFAGAVGGASFFLRHGPPVMMLPLACLAAAALLAARSAPRAL